MDQTTQQSSHAEVLAFPHITRKEEQMLHTVLDNMSQGVVMFDSQMQLIFCNQRYVEMYGLSADVAQPGCSLRELHRASRRQRQLRRRPGRIYRRADRNARRRRYHAANRHARRRPRLFGGQQADRRRRLAVDPRGRHRTAALGRAHRAHGAPRRAHRPAQPHHDARASRARAQARQARRVPGGALPRPRPVQERQRRARPSDRRRAAASWWPSGCAAARASRTPWRGWAATSSPSS